ncbi:hypothetical protein [Pseudomonas sp. MPC6]|uniref:hypothetical protein n=1 Tax=unclassified Pseudomonas TaxID=196821 RepID=UPI0011103BCA|nr:hypothetical protein [Pseudomonas sp. MPC6]QCY11125.1 hypothetical protein ELQ88_10025 [Pseudomonas sp. MPC6]
MALSAFGDELSAFGDALEPPSQPVPAAAPAAKALSAFGDDLDDGADHQPGVVDRIEHAIDNSFVGAIGRDLARGGVNTGDSLMGIAGLLSGGRIPQALGYDSSGIRQHINAQDSPEQQAARQQMDQAQGVGGTLQVLRDNPSLVGHMAVESVPSMVGGGLAGRGIATGLKAAGVGAGRAGLVGAGAGEGLIGAGQQAEQTRQATGTLTPSQTGLALLSGGLTGLLGVAGARIGRKLGVADIDAQMAGANGADVAKGMVNRALVGTGIESLEELSQSGQQQVLTNLATDRPALEGVDKQMVLGGVVGGAMGAGASLRRPVVPMAMPAQQQQGMPQPTPAAMPTPGPAAIPAPIAPQGLHAQVMAATQPQQAPAVPAATPFAGSQDINPLLDRLGVQGEQRNTTLKLLEPVELNVQDARRGVQSNAERDRLAQLIGLQGTDARVFNRKIGEALNAEQTVAAVTNVQDHLKDVLSLQQRIATGQASDIDRASFIQSLGQLRSTFADLAGARAEAGRALSAYKRQAMDYAQAQAVLEAVNGAGGADNAAKALGKAMQSGGLSNAAKLIRQPEGKMSRLLGYYYRAALLSGVRTHAVNVLSNSMTLGNEIIERGVAAGVSGVKNIFKPGSGQTVFAEPVDMLVGMAKNTMQAGRAATDAFVTGDSPMLGGGKQETGTPDMNNPRPPGALPTAAWAADRIASLPYRALGAEDAWFASLNYAAEMRTIARQQAVAEKKLGTLPPGMKLSQRIDAIVQNPTSKMIEAAGEHARTATFNTQAGDFTQAIMRAKTKMPWLNLIVPFIRTPVNIVKYGFKRTPLAGLMPSVRADIMAGGAKQERAIARMLWGTSVMIGAGALAQAGYITGAGPEDKEEKAALMATGWRPYSIKVGDTYHEYSRLDPFSQWLGLASDLATMDYQHKDAGDLATTALSSLVNNTVNKTYMQGVSNLVEFLQDPQRNAGWYVRQMAGTLAQPVTLASNIASENDPYARETNSVLDQIRYRTPGLRQDLPAKLDHFGEPVPNRTYPGGPLSIASPIAQSKETTDPVRIEAARIGWAPGKPQPHFTVKGKRYDLTDEQMGEFNELTGKLMHKSVQRAMQSKGWAALGDDEKRDFLDAELKKARTAVRLALIPLVANGNRRAIDNLLRATGHPGVKK